MGGHAALPLPETPRDRGGREALRAAPLGESVEEDVGGGVVGLTWSAEGPPDRREEDECRKVHSGAQLVQVPGPIHLGGEDVRDLLGTQRLDRAVGKGASA